MIFLKILFFITTVFLTRKFVIKKQSQKLKKFLNI